MRAAIAICLTGVLLAPMAGCSRSRARLSADNDAYLLIDQKASAVDHELGDYRIDINPQSRMYDQDDPDCPPMPPDDPVSHRYLQVIDGKRHAKLYRTAERTPWVENPNWLSYMPRDEQGRLVLDTQSAVRVGLLHDPDFQDELEQLYLSALDVAFERFQFDTQLFGGAALDFVHAGRDASGSGSSSSQFFVNPSSSRAGPAAPNRWRVSRLTATGGELVAGFANTLVWQFSGSNNYSSSTLLDFSLVQPLLRGGGRIRVLEVLTVAERALLANVRSMERFQREYYVNVVTGRGTGSGPTRIGGLLGGAGIANFAGVGLQVGNFGGGFGGGGFGGGGQAGAASANGFLGLLQTQQVLANQRANAIALRDSTLQLEASYDAGRIDRFQVDLARQALFEAQSQLLNAEAGFETTLDNYKIDLGLPPDLPLLLDDPLLESFQLLSPEVTDLQNQVTDRLLANSETPPREAGPDEAPAPVEEVPVDPGLQREEVDALLAEARVLLQTVESDLVKLMDVAPTRREHLAEMGTRPEVVAARIDLGVFDPDRFDARVEAIHRDLGLWRDSYAQLEADAAAGGDPESLLRRLSAHLLELSILQAKTRLDALDLEPTAITPRDALEIARVNRRDWANSRAALVDQWRLIHFNANNLRSAVDVVFSGDIGNVGDNPFDLRGSNGTLRAGLQFDSPTSRLAERNVYRQSLIEYQQSRRSYYQFVDRVHQGLRGTLRQIRLNEVNFELRREAVLVAIAQVDITQLRLSEPPKPGVDEQFGSTTARDLVQALGSLLSAQNDLLSVWVNNRVQRFNLELDLGVMMVDAEGLRVPIDTPLTTLMPAEGCPGGGDVSLIPGLPVITTPLEGPAYNEGMAPTEAETGEDAVIRLPNVEADFIETAQLPDPPLPVRVAARTEPATTEPAQTEKGTFEKRSVGPTLIAPEEAPEELTLLEVTGRSSPEGQ